MYVKINKLEWEREGEDNDKDPHGFVIANSKYYDWRVKVGLEIIHTF